MAPVVKVEILLAALVDKRRPVDDPELVQEILAKVKVSLEVSGILCIKQK